MPVLIASGLILLVCFLRNHSRHKSPVKAAVVNMLVGVASLVLVALLPFTSAAVNIYTVFTSLTLGLPGTALVLIANAVFV